MTPEQHEQIMQQLKAQTGLLVMLQKQLEKMAQANAPLSPNYRRRLSEYPGFDWQSISAVVEAQDQHGPTELEWNNHRWTRRRSKGEDDSFGEAIWYSRPAGDSEKSYYILIKFADYKAKKIGDDLAGSVQSKAQEQPPAAPKVSAEFSQRLDQTLGLAPPSPAPAKTIKLPPPPAAKPPIAAPVENDPRALFYDLATKAKTGEVITFEVFNALVARASREGYEAALAGLREILTKAGAVELLAA